MTIGGADISAFVGVDGPYWTDVDYNGEVGWALPRLTDGDDDDSYVDVLYYSTDNFETAGIAYGDIDMDGMVDANETADPNAKSWLLPSIIDGSIAYISDTSNGSSGIDAYGDLSNSTVIDPDETAELNQDAIGLALTDLRFWFCGDGRSVN